MLSQATERWPSRSRRSDGICASPDHNQQNPDSDHQLGEAADLTHDPFDGCDAHAEVRRIAERRDPRVKYLISARQIWTPVSLEWRHYGGKNAHFTHAHISIHHWARGDTSPWFLDPEDDMPKPTDFTSACKADGVGYFTQTFEGGVNGHDGAFVSADSVKRTYKDHAAQLGPRTFLAIIPNGVGGFVQIATDGTRWNSKDWT